MYLMIDNYDSFVYNLACYFEELGQEVKLVRNDKITVQQIKATEKSGELEGIIISPGPKSPKDCGVCREIVTEFSRRVPILGVCLGHQIIGHVFGAVVEKGERPMHGKVTKISTNGKGLFQNLPLSYDVTRYHSLVVCRENLPACIEVDAWSEDGVIMGMHHKKLPVYGVQFHPEAVLTQYGHELLNNFIKICGERRGAHGNNDSEAFVL